MRFYNTYAAVSATIRHCKLALYSFQLSTTSYSDHAFLHYEGLRAGQEQQSFEPG